MAGMRVVGIVTDLFEPNTKKSNLDSSPPRMVYFVHARLDSRLSALQCQEIRL